MKSCKILMFSEKSRVLLQNHTTGSDIFHCGKIRGYTMLRQVSGVNVLHISNGKWWCDCGLPSRVSFFQMWKHSSPLALVHEERLTVRVRTNQKVSSVCTTRLAFYLEVLFLSLFILEAQSDCWKCLD